MIARLGKTIQPQRTIEQKGESTCPMIVRQAHIWLLGDRNDPERLVNECVHIPGESPHEQVRVWKVPHETGPGADADRVREHERQCEEQRNDVPRRPGAGTAVTLLRCRPWHEWHIILCVFTHPQGSGEAEKVRQEKSRCSQ